MKYHVSFHMKSKPPVEELTIEGREREKDTLPGQAALELINAGNISRTWKNNNRQTGVHQRPMEEVLKEWEALIDNEDDTLEDDYYCLDLDTQKGIRQFMESFSVTALKESGGEITSQEALVERLFIEQGILRGFVEDVLLFLPEQFPELENVPSHIRLAVYLKTVAESQGLEDYFRQISFIPSSTLGTEFRNMEGKEEEKKRKQFQSAIDLLSKDYEAGKPRKDLSKFYSFSWRYETDNILSLCWLELFLMAEAGLKIKPCRKCGSYYLPWPSNALHCSNCKKEYHPQKLHREYIKENMTKADKEIIRAQQAEYMRAYRKKKKEKRKEAEQQNREQKD